MMDYTERISRLMTDIVARVPALSFIDMRRVLVFARAGRTGADGAYATCHCLSLPPSDPGYYYWRDRSTGALTRRSEWFVTKSPRVIIGAQPIDYLISFALPRFCDQRLSHLPKRAHYRGQPDWVGKLDTIVHELYHIDPGQTGIRRMEPSDGTAAADSHGRRFFADVVEMVTQYLATRPDPAMIEFLQWDATGIEARFGGMVGTAFRGFPAYPKRFIEALDPQPAPPPLDCRVQPVAPPRRVTFTDADLVTRAFGPAAGRQPARRSARRAA